jgi:hypothetical protein
VTPGRQVKTGPRCVKRHRAALLDAAERGHHVLVLEDGEVDHDEVVDVDPGVLLDVLIVHAAPSTVWFPYRLPSANASLILNWVGEDSCPSPIRQDGMFTHESRGIDITSAHCLSAGMWMTISVSDWSVVPVPNLPSMPAPCRVSDPMTTMFSACGCRLGGLLPSSPLMLAWSMLSLK